MAAIKYDDNENMPQLYLRDSKIMKWSKFAPMIVLVLLPIIIVSSQKV